MSVLQGISDHAETKIVLDTVEKALIQNYLRIILVKERFSEQGRMNW